MLLELRRAGKSEREKPYLRDTLPVHASEQNGPCDAAGVLPLQKEGFGLSVDETEDLGVSSHIELTLHIQENPSQQSGIGIYLS